MPRVNVKFLILLLAATVLVSAGVHVLHIFQADRIAQALLWQARHEQEEGHARQAAKYLSRYLEFVPRDNEVRIELGDTLEPLAATPRQRAQVYLILDQVLRTEPERHELRRRVVPMAMELGRTPDAVAHLQVLLQAAPEDGELEYLMGQCQEATGQFAEAAQLFESASRHKPDYIASHVQLATVLRRRLNQPDRADQVMNDMVKTNPKAYLAYLARGRYLQQFGKSREAADKDLAQALQLAPNEADVLLANAEAAQKREDREAARKYLERGCRLHPKEMRMYQGLAWLALWDKDRAGALAWVRRGLEALPNQRELLWTLADVLIQGGDPKEQAEARDVIARLGKSGYPASAIDYLKASLLVRNQQWAEGAQVLERNRSLAAASPQLARQTDLLLGQCYERLDEPDRQLDAYRRVLAGDPTSELARQGLAAALASMGKFDEAIAEYQKLPAQSRQGVATNARSIAVARLAVMRNLRLPPDQRKWDGVQEYLTKAGQENPDAVEVTVLGAEVLVAQKQFQPARELLEKQLRAKPNQVELWIALAGVAEREKNNPQAAVSVLDEADKKVGDRVPLRLARARYLVDRRGKTVSKDLNRLSTSIEQFSADEQVRLLSGLGETYYRAGKSAEAAHLWNQAAAKQPNDLRIRSLLLDVALQSNDQAELQQVLKDIRRIEGENGVLWSFGEARRLLGLAKKGDKQYLAEARALLDGVASRRPSWPAVALCRAEIDEVQGDAETAIGNYKQAITAGERSPYTVNRLVQLLVERKRYDEADQLLREMQQRNALPALLRKLAAEVALQTRKDPARALQLAQQAVPEDTKDYRDYLWLGQMLFALKQKNSKAEAEKALRQANRLAEAEPETWLALVQFQMSTGHRDRAVKTIEDAQRKLPPAKARLTLAQCYEAIGQADKEARENYKAALEGPSSSDARTLRLVADFFLRTGQNPDATALLRKIIDAPRQTSWEEVAWARRSLALVLASAGEYRQFGEALALLDQNTSGGGTVDDQRTRAAVLATQKSRRLAGSNETARRQAIRLLEDLAQKNKANNDDRFLLAQLYEGEGDWNKARAKMLDLLSLPEKRPQHLAYCARSFLKQGQVVEAQRVWLTELEKAERDSLRTLTVRARVLEAQGKTDEIIDLLAKLVEKQDDTQETRLNFAASLLDELSQASAARKLSAAAQKLAAAAEKSYRAFLAQQPKQIHGFVLFLSRQGRLREALDLCEAAWQAQPPEPELTGGTCVAALRAGVPNAEQFQRVDGWIKAALEKHPQKTMLLVHLADVRDIQGRFDEAEKLYRQALSRDDRNLVALNNLAWLLAQRNAKSSEALTLINRAIDLVGPMGELLDTRAVVHLSMDRIEPAIEDLQDAIRETPTASCYFHLARAHQLAKNHEAALSAFQQAKASKLEVNHLHPLERGAFRQLLGELEQR